MHLLRNSTAEQITALSDCVESGSAQ